jgi:uncharacterized MAPEG superfamily protein
MTIGYWCVLIAGLLPYVAVAFAKVGRNYDNHNPRDWLAKQEGRARRAHAAHLNSFEALPLFVGGVVIAAMLQVPQAQIDALALVFIAARIVYIWCYLADLATARSIAWVVGIGTSIGLFVAAAVK